MTTTEPFFLKAVSEALLPGRPLLAIHGLNQNPDALLPMLRDLEQRRQQKAYMFTLRGHRAEPEKQLGTPAQAIEEEFREVYQYLVNQHQQTPDFIGYSYGGLLGVLLAPQFPMASYNLLAPALALRFYAPWVKAILPFQKNIPSMPIGNAQLEAHYRYWTSGAPREIYSHFFHFYDRWKKSPVGLPQGRGQIICHARDELVSSNGLKKLVRQTPGWSFHEVDNQQAELKTFRHLIFDTKVLGGEEYHRLLNILG